MYREARRSRLKMAKVRLKLVESSRVLGVSRRRTHLKSVASVSQDGGVSKWTSSSRTRWPDDHSSGQPAAP
eukprot:762593-Prymnesium_polylepis.1